MESDPRTLLQRVAARPSSDLPMGAVLQRAGSLRRRRRATVGMLVAMLLVAGSVGLAQDWDASPVPPITPDESPSPSAVDSTRSFSVEGFPTAVAVGDGSVWVADWTVSRLDESSGEVTARIRLPGHANALAFEDEHLWAFVEINEGKKDGRYVSVIDPETDKIVATSPRLFDTNVGSASQNVMAIGNGSAWVGFRGELYRIDHSPGSSELSVTKTDLPRPFRVADKDSGAYTIAFGGESVWLTKGNGRIVRLDPATGEVLGETELGWNLIGMTAGSASMWVSHATPTGRHRLFRIDYADGAAAKMAVDLGMYDQYWEARAGGSSLWLVRSAKGKNVVELDEATGSEIGRRRMRIPAFFGAAASDSALWLGWGGNRAGTVTRVPSQR
jgi:DNA-binding beta-propeller fold protein YncE